MENSDIMKELEGLISLAESSAKEIDSLLVKRDGVNTQIILFFLLLVAITVVLAAITDRFNKYTEIILSAFVVALCAVAYAIFTRVCQRAKMRGDLRVEHNIHQKLLSLIDEQINRLPTHSSLMSPVARATIDIRVRRLDRTDRMRDSKNR